MSGREELEKDLNIVREETYHRKLEENILLKENFIKMGKSSLANKLSTSKEIENQDELQKLKRESLALYETLKAVPFTPQRDDLIGGSLADQKMAEQVDDLEMSFQNLERLNKANMGDLNYINSLIFNLKLFNKLIDSKEQSTQISREKSITQSDLSNTIDNLENRELRLIDYIKDVIFNYVVKLNNYYGDQDTLKKAQYLKLMEKLLNSSNQYIEVPPELQNDSILRQLLLGHVIQQQQNFKFIKMNEFGL